MTRGKKKFSWSSLPDRAAVARSQNPTSVIHFILCLTITDRDVLTNSITMQSCNREA